jgi:hypothetical protein
MPKDGRTDVWHGAITVMMTRSVEDLRQALRRAGVTIRKPWERPRAVKTAECASANHTELRGISDPSSSLPA